VPRWFRVSASKKSKVLTSQNFFSAMLSLTLLGEWDRGHLSAWISGVDEMGSTLTKWTLI
jgi:hypothetical protein